MVIDTILGIFITLLTGVLDLLPTDPAPPDLASMVAEAFGWMDLGGLSGDALGFVAQWVPIETLAACIGAMLLWFVAIHGLRLLAWLLALIHVGGTDA